MLRISKKSTLIFLIMMTIFTLLFSACTSKKVAIVSLATGKEYTLPLKAENILSGGNYLTYESEQNLSQMCETLKQNGYNCAVFNDNFILIKNMIDGKTDYLVIGKLGGQKRYQFMSAAVMDNNGDYFLFPIHLTAKKGSDFNAGEDYSFITLTDTPVCATIADIKTFYTDAGIFNIEEEENSLTISVKQNEFVHKLSKTTFSVSLRTDGKQTFVELKTDGK